MSENCKGTFILRRGGGACDCYKCQQVQLKQALFHIVGVAKGIERVPGNPKVESSNPELGIIFFFFLHNEVRDGGWGAQRPVLHDVILTQGEGGWPAIMSTAKTCCKHTAAVVKWIVQMPGIRKIAGSNLGWEIFSFFLHNKVRDGGRGAFLDGCTQRTGA